MVSIVLDGFFTALFISCARCCESDQGQGMPSQRHHEPGDMFVQLNVKFPEIPGSSRDPGSRVRVTTPATAA